MKKIILLIMLMFGMMGCHSTKHFIINDIHNTMHKKNKTLPDMYEYVVDYDVNEETGKAENIRFIEMPQNQNFKSK